MDDTRARMRLVEAAIKAREDSLSLAFASKQAFANAEKLEKLVTDGTDIEVQKAIKALESIPCPSQSN